ncbi:MAG: hypothetical protein OSA04_00420 [Flavobacteriales bacterium]|nr:hypothetical protein [Flavobacteriales bacterium]
MSYKRIVLIALAIVTIVVGVITLAVLLNENHWKSTALEKVNNELLTELSVRDVGVSIWREFPKVTVDLYDVILLGSVSHIGETADTLVKAQRLGVAFSLWDVLFGDPVIDALFIEGAVLHLKEHRNGTWNTDILVTKKEVDVDESLAISQIILREIEVIASTIKEDRYECKIPDAIVKDGSFESSFSDFVIKKGQGSDRLLPLEGYVSTSYKIGEDGEVEVKINDAVINDLAFKGKAQINAEGDEEWRIEIESDNIEIEELKSIWAEKDVFNGWDYDGAASISLNASPKKANLAWSLSEGSFAISPKLTGLTLNTTGNIQTSGVFDYSPRKSSVGLSVTNIQITSNGITVNAKAECADLKKSPLKLSGSLKIDAQSSYASWVPKLQTTEMSALPNNGEVTIDGRLKISSSGKIYDVLAEISSQKIEGALNASPYLIRNLEAEVKGENLTIHSFDFDWNGNRGGLDGSLMGLEKWHEGGALKGTMNLKAESIVVDGILAWWGNFQPDNEVNTQATLLPLGSDVEIKVAVDRLYWDNLECRSLTSRMDLGASRLAIRNATGKGLQGNARVEGSLRPGGSGWILGLSGTADHLSLPDLFKTYNNFGQTTLRSDHVQGAVSAAGNINLEWDLNGNWISDGLLSNLDVEINHGRLRNFEVFGEVADYLKDHRLIAPLVDPEDLRGRLKDIEFAHIESSVIVVSSSTTIPYFNIQSSAMNVSLEGRHTFSGQIDYTLGFALRDLRDSRQVEFGDIEDDNLGSIFFLAMDGTLEEPIYSYDREAHKSHRKKAISTELDRLRNSLQGSDSNQDEDDAKPEGKSGKEKKSKRLDDIEDEDF